MAQKSNLTIEVLSIIGGVLTAIFFLGFLVLSSILRSETSCLITGSILIITTLFVNRLLTKPFLDAMNITCYIAGCILAGYGMNRNMDVLFIVLIGISVVTMLLSKGFILTFLSVLSYTNGDLSKYKPIHSGLFVSCVLSLAGLSVNYLTKSTNDWIISVFMLVGILLMVYKIVQVMQVKSPVHQVCIYLLCILICFPSLHAPYLSGSILLILICFQYGYKAESAVALLLFIYSISKYYYDLDITLLTKSITLFFTGIALLIAWYIFTQKKTRHEKI